MLFKKWLEKKNRIATERRQKQIGIGNKIYQILLRKASGINIQNLFEGASHFQFSVSSGVDDMNYTIMVGIPGQQFMGYETYDEDGSKTAGLLLFEIKINLKNPDETIKVSEPIYGSKKDRYYEVNRYAEIISYVTETLRTWF